MEWLLVMVAIVALMLVARRYLGQRVWAARKGEAFSGALLRLGENLACCLNRVLEHMTGPGAAGTPRPRRQFDQ